MTAKEMFEELGFEYGVNDINQIYAINDEEGTDLWFLNDKKVFEYNGYINVDLLKAINKQVEELGWDNE